MECFKTAVICILIYPISCQGTTGILFKIEKGKRAQSNIMAIKYAVSEVDCILQGFADQQIDVRIEIRQPGVNARDRRRSVGFQGIKMRDFFL